MKRSSASRRNSLDHTLQDLEKRFGDGIVMKLGENPALKVESIPTGALSLDIALGVGGVPVGRILEVYGHESSGKTTLCLHVIAEAQKAGGLCGFVDVEHALDPDYAKRIGVDVNELYVSQPDTGEAALEVAEALVTSGELAVVVVDSVAALVPKQEIDGEMGDAHVGLQARLMSQALRKLTAPVKNSGCTLIFTNQIRQRVGVMFGNPETTSGGMALRFYASVRMEIRRQQAIKDGTETIGNKTKVTVRKNKVAPPFRIAEFDIMYNQGISSDADILNLAIEHDLIDQRGSFFRYNDELLGQGRAAAVNSLSEQPELTAHLRDLICQKVGLTSPESPDDDTDA